MSLMLSPGINVSEVDLSTVVPSVSTSVGAIAGPFSWGPSLEIMRVSDGNVLSKIFGQPDENNYEYWFTAKNFLSYSNNLKVVRAIGSNSYNSVATSQGLVIKNSNDYEENYSSGTVTTYGPVCAKWVGEIGDSLSVSICPNAEAFSQNVSDKLVSTTSVPVTTDDSSVNVSVSMANNIAIGDLISLKFGTTETEYAEVANITATTITINGKFSANIESGGSVTRKWKYAQYFSDAPKTSDYTRARNGSDDEVHIVIVDSKGMFSGVKGKVLQTIPFASKASDSKTANGSTNYYKNILNQSQYIWWLSHPTGTSNWGTKAIDANYIENNPLNMYFQLSNGDDGIIDVGDITTAYNMFNNSDNLDMSLLISGPSPIEVSNHLIDIADTRKDCLVFVSPLKTDVINNTYNEASSVLSTRDKLKSSSFAVMDSGWKYQYDSYNDVYRWIPLNGDIAGLCAKIDRERDPWHSPAGSSKGVIKNIIKLAWNPTQSERDDIYLKGVNPVVSFPGEGIMLYGDKTLLSRPSAFDRINVRRLFIVLEKSISIAARSTLFEFNDQFTRAQFVSLVEPYLRDIKGRRGITDFRVVCDETNNTPEVIDRNEFIGDIYIKPTRSVNYIILNFVAVRTGVDFNEIVGQF